MADDINSAPAPKRRRRKAAPLLLPFDDTLPGEAKATAALSAGPAHTGPAEVEILAPHRLQAEPDEPAAEGEARTGAEEAAQENAPPPSPPARRRKRAAAAPVSPPPDLETAQEENNVHPADGASLVTEGSRDASEPEAIGEPDLPASEVTAPADIARAEVATATAQMEEGEPVADAVELTSSVGEPPTAFGPVEAQQSGAANEPIADEVLLTQDPSAAQEPLAEAEPESSMEAAPAPPSCDEPVTHAAANWDEPVPSEKTLAGKTEADDRPDDGHSDDASDLLGAGATPASTAPQAGTTEVRAESVLPEAPNTALSPTPSPNAAPKRAPRTRKGVRVAGVAIGAGQAGALALGALAIGALAIGALAIGRLAVGRARVRRLEVDELVIGTVTQKEKTRRR